MNFADLDFPPTSLDQLIATVDQEFDSRFGRPAQIVAAAPGRVNLIGEHIDYNDGIVLPMAVERYVVVAADLRRDNPAPTTRVCSLNLQATATIELQPTADPESRDWSRYVAGVIAGFQSMGIEIPPFDAVFQSNIPLGGGLSSSAALEVATATVLEAMTGNRLPAREKALLCQQAEHRFVGVPCGIMDQFSSVFGQANQLMMLDCRTQQIVPIPLADHRVTTLIVDSAVKHELTGGEYAERRRQCDSALAKLNRSSWRDVTLDALNDAKDTLTPVERRRARHVVTEIRRTLEAAEAIQGEDWPHVGELMYASHSSLRDDYEVSCAELDLLVELAQDIGTAGGVLGSRMTGGGFGGCTVSLVQSSHLDNVLHRLRDGYQAHTGIQAHGFATRPAQGAYIVRR